MNHIGKCHICGNTTKLSFEHVPPKKAFNNRPLVYTALKEMIGIDPKNAFSKGKIVQRGAGAYTLCEQCNNNTGSWYGGSFVEWVEQGMEILRKATGWPTLVYPFHIYPLRVIKQIVCMFFSANNPNFQHARPELVKFALNKYDRFLNNKIRIYAFYTTSSFLRQVGVTGLLKLGKGTSIFSEITFPPFGYIMSLDSKPHDSRLFDISGFARYNYDTIRTINLRLPVLNVGSHLPGDYRTNAEIQKTFQENTRKEFLRNIIAQLNQLKGRS